MTSAHHKISLKARIEFWLSLVRLVAIPSLASGRPLFIFEVQRLLLPRDVTCGRFAAHPLDLLKRGDLLPPVDSSNMARKEVFVLLRVAAWGHGVTGVFR